MRGSPVCRRPFDHAERVFSFTSRLSSVGFIARPRSDTRSPAVCLNVSFSPRLSSTDHDVSLLPSAGRAHRRRTVLRSRYGCSPAIDVLRQRQVRLLPLFDGPHSTDQLLHRRGQRN